ncbi:MAG: serine hydrolase [Bacteroidota bacterium]
MKKPTRPTTAFKTEKKPKKLLHLIMFSLTFLMATSVGLNVYLGAKTISAKKEKFREAQVGNPSPVSYIRERQDPSQLSHPLLLADDNSESPRFSSLRYELQKLIRDYETDGSITSVSVYMTTLNDMSGMGIGPDDAYLPGSLMKVPILIYYLKQEQDHPGTLKKEFVYERPRTGFPQQNYPGDSIVSGRKYKVSELLHYMIAESDNNATYVLSTHIDGDEYRKIYTDLDIPPYEVSNTLYSISPRQYSKFFKVLYNASYLNESLSEYALNILSECNFRDGLVKELPKGIITAHKFGERAIDYDVNFSESAIVYYNSNPYLLTIMTRGRDVKHQTVLVSELSKAIYSRYGDI